MRKNKVADFCSAKYNISFEERDELLMDYGELRGGSAADVESSVMTMKREKLRSEHIVMSGAMNERD